MTDTPCTWPNGTCACYLAEQAKPDPYDRVWMHCDEGLSMTKASMGRFMEFCLRNNVEIGDVHPFNRNYKGCQVSVAIRIYPDLFESFEKETRGKLRKPPRIVLNSGGPDHD